MHKKVWALAWPMMLSNISVPMLGIVDTAILGHLDNIRYLGAVAVGSSILTFVFWAFGFLRMGTTSLIARAHGRNDLANIVLVLLQSAILAVLLALFLFSLQDVLFGAALKWMDASREVSVLAQSYCQIRIFSAPATLLNFVIIGWFIGRQNTRIPLLILVSQNILNIALDAWFIIALSMNSDGAAIATVIAEYAGLALGLVLLCKHLRPHWYLFAAKKLSHWHSYAEILRINRHLFIRTACLLFTFAFFTAQGAQQSDQLLAANAILLQLLLLISYGLDGFAHAAEALIGKSVGEKNQREFNKACLVTTQWAFVTALTFSAFFIFLQSKILLLFTSLPDVIEIAGNYYGWIIILPLLGIWGYQLDGIFIGAGKTQAMQYTMLLSLFTVFLPTWWLFQSFGNWGLWLALSAFMISRGLFLGSIFIYHQHHRNWFLK